MHYYHFDNRYLSWATKGIHACRFGNIWVIDFSCFGNPFLLFADRVIFIDEGVICEQGDPKEFFANPKTDRAKEFLSKGKSTPFLGEEVYGRCVLTVMDGKVVYHE